MLKKVAHAHKGTLHDMTQIDPISPDLSLLVSISPPGPIFGRCVFPYGGLCMPRQKVINHCQSLSL